MFKILVSFLFLLAFLPLNAQRLVKYITFYPIPYGSHQTLDVKDKAVLSARNGGETYISGALTVPRASAYDGSLFLEAKGTNKVSTTGQIRSGDSATLMAYGEADITGPSTSIEAVESILNDVIVAGETKVSKTTIFDGRSLESLSTCDSGTPAWKALRLKGSEECKYYLTCRGSGNTGCDAAPDLPECEFGAWHLATGPVVDTCGGLQKNGCMNVSACGAADRPCTKLREAVTGQIQTTFNCGRGYQPNAYCFQYSQQCTDANVSAFCGSHGGPERMIINGSSLVAETCSFANINDATFWCRENQTKKGCLMYGNAASYDAELACKQSYTITGSGTSNPKGQCFSASVNVYGFVCQDGPDDPDTLYYRVCGGV